MGKFKDMGQRAVWRIVDQRFQDIYYDLLDACVETLEPPRIHEGDLKSFLYDDMLVFFGTYERYRENEHLIVEAIRDRCQPDKEGWIWL